MSAPEANPVFIRPDDGGEWATVGYLKAPPKPLRTVARCGSILTRPVARPCQYAAGHDGWHRWTSDDGREYAQWVNEPTEWLDVATPTTDERNHQ